MWCCQMTDIHHDRVCAGDALLHHVIKMRRRTNGAELAVSTPQQRVVSQRCLVVLHGVFMAAGKLRDAPHLIVTGSRHGRL